jgi:hypothetical protein
MISKTYTIPVGNLKPSKKKWWQIWRKNGDSAEEILKDLVSIYSGNINTVKNPGKYFKSFERKNSIHRIYKIEPIPLAFKKDYWFPNR